MSEKKETKSFIGRVANFGASRFRHTALFRRSRKNIASNADAASSSLRPADLDLAEAKRGLRGRYADGGRQRFHDMLEDKGMNIRQADFLGRRHIQSGMIFAAAAVLMLAYGLWSITQANDHMSLFSGISLTLMFFVFMALGVRHDFSAWQIRERRFGGFNEYLEFRLG